MKLKNSLIIFICASLFSACGIYSFTGAAIDGKTINIHFIENNARTIAPALSATLTEKVRQHITSLSSLAVLDNDKTDYDLKGNITEYRISVASIQGNETSAKNRLTITVQMDFVNRIDDSKNFNQSFTRFADFEASENFQTVENILIEDITDQLKDDIFNKAFVNW